MFTFLNIICLDNLKLKYMTVKYASVAQPTEKYICFINKKIAKRHNLYLYSA